MKVKDIFSILDDNEKEEMYKLSKEYHEKKILVESENGTPISKIEDYGFRYYFSGEEGTTSFINTKAFENDYVFDFFRRHNYTDKITFIPKGNKKSEKYLVDIFKNMNFKVVDKSTDNILLKRKVGISDITTADKLR